MNDDIELPIMPSPRMRDEFPGYFTQDQMRAYARSAVLADRERRDRPDTTLWEDIKGVLGFPPFSLRAWCRQNECARMVQWPVYWADAMLAARENSND